MTTLFDLNQFTNKPQIKSVVDPYWDEPEEVILDCSGKDDKCNWTVLPFPEQEEEEFIEDVVLEELQPHNSTLPEQKVKQWVEKYYVSRGGHKFWYFRYCYYERKIYHIHIPGGSVDNAIAQFRRQMIEKAIALGKTHWEIQHFIRGGFGRNGNRMINELLTPDS